MSAFDPAPAAYKALARERIAAHAAEQSALGCRPRRWHPRSLRAEIGFARLDLRQAGRLAAMSGPERRVHDAEDALRDAYGAPLTCRLATVEAPLRADLDRARADLAAACTPMLEAA